MKKNVSLEISKILQLKIPLKICKKSYKNLNN